MPQDTERQLWHDICLCQEEVNVECGRRSHDDPSKRDGEDSESGRAAGAPSLVARSGTTRGASIYNAVGREAAMTAT